MSAPTDSVFIVGDYLVFGLAERKHTAVRFYADPCGCIWVTSTSCDTVGVESYFAVANLAHDVRVDADRDHNSTPCAMWSRKRSTTALTSDSRLRDISSSE